MARQIRDETLDVADKRSPGPDRFPPVQLSRHYRLTLHLVSRVNRCGSEFQAVESGIGSRHPGLLPISPRDAGEVLLVRSKGHHTRCYQTLWIKPMTRDLNCRRGSNSCEASATKLETFVTPRRWQFEARERRRRGF